jgi:hypothetical protein
VRRTRAGKRIAAERHPGYQNQHSNKRQASHTSMLRPSCELWAIDHEGVHGSSCDGDAC